MTREYFFEILDKYINGQASPEDEATYNAFFEALQNKATKWSLDDRERIKVEIYRRISKRVFPAKKLKTERKDNVVRLVVLWVAAASILIIAGTVGLYFVLHESAKIHYETFATQVRQKATLVLTDGTVVKLNSLSSIQYPSEFNSTSREVFLSGEAFFEVAKDSTKPFIIHTNGLATRVLGTSFNIKAYQGESIEISVSTGKVRVYPDGVVQHSTAGGDIANIGKGLLLTHGQQAVFNPSSGALTLGKANLEQELAWRDNIIYIGESTLAETARVLERWYGITIVFKDSSIRSTLISGKFNSDRLENILESLKFTKNINYKMEGDIVVLSK